MGNLLQYQTKNYFLFPIILIDEFLLGRFKH